MDGLGSRPDWACPQLFIAHEAGQDCPRALDPQHEVSAPEQRRLDTQDDRVRCRGHDLPTEDMIGGGSRPEPKTQADPPTRHDERPQCPRGVLEGGPCPLLGRTRIPVGNRDLPGSRIVRLRKRVEGPDLLACLDTTSVRCTNAAHGAKVGHEMGAVAMMEPATATRFDPSVHDIRETIPVGWNMASAPPLTIPPGAGARACVRCRGAWRPGGALARPRWDGWSGGAWGWPAPAPVARRGG